MLKLSSCHVLHTTGLLQIHSKFPRARARAGVIVVILKDDMLETDEK